MIDINIQNEIVKLKDWIDNLETVLNTRFNLIEYSIYAVLETILQKLLLNILFYFHTHFYLQNRCNNDIQKNVLFS